MPSYIIVKSSGRIGETIDATLCDPGVLGFPDRKTDVPVRVRRTSEQTLCIDGEPRPIISSIGENGVTTFPVNGSTRGVRNRERRAGLARASELLKQLTTSLMALRAESEEPELVAENLQILSDWLTRERERATTAPKGIPR